MAQEQRSSAELLYPPLQAEAALLGGLSIDGQGPRHGAVRPYRGIADMQLGKLKPGIAAGPRRGLTERPPLIDAPSGASRMVLFAI